MSDDSSSSEDEEPEVVTRVEWHARPPLRVREFDEPPADIVYSETETKTCSTKRECIKIIQEIQNYQMDVRGLPDIQYNFLVGGDGNVYEGRGWNYIGQVSPQQHSLPPEVKDKVIEVGFIGDFSEKAPPKHMVKVASGLLMAGVNSNKLILREHKDHMLTEEEVEALKKKNTVVVRGYGNEHDMLTTLLNQKTEKNEKETSEKNESKTKKQ
ncbi:peptidoglycan-recognition protein 1-like [Macrosteles quadrilineatus]|uniref:peptidoglycan-recognition protein 1-like n=1 Tax=Macrosteles quadrilineatus TaxID=74068 RepID=UPI0023E30E87|nr:peptidoglycan-recognition protein 1-like [Macrosteles quadrilineatus]